MTFEANRRNDSGAASDERSPLLDRGSALVIHNRRVGQTTAASDFASPARREGRGHGASTPRTLYAEDLTVGDAWVTSERPLSESDVADFAELTGDHTPLHGDGQVPSPFGKPIVHGLLGLSVLAGLGTTCPNAATLALVGIDGWEFVAPVYFGDRVRGRNEIVSIDPHGRRAAKVRWFRQLINATGRVVQQGYFVTLVASKRRGSLKPR